MPDILNRNNNVRRRVLVVDDEPVNRMLLGNIVGQEYEVLYASDGEEALDAIKENKGTLSLVLLDLLMPNTDGFEVLKVLGADEELRRIPVIVLTSEKSAEVDALKLGAVDFIQKPYDAVEVIMARIRRSIELAEDKILVRENEFDALTGLYTEGFFLQYARRYDRYHPDEKMDAVVININRFRLINDIRGRAYGDMVLEKMGKCLKELLREKGGLGCRARADIFYLYIPRDDNYGGVTKRVEARFSELTEQARVTFRVGVWQSEDSEIDMKRRFELAASAFSELKQSYETGFRVFDEKSREREIRDEELILSIDSAIEERQFQVYYQPKYAIQGSRPVLSSAEALIRWIKPQEGVISPGVFIPLFEENNLVSKLDRFVWKETAAQIARWKKQYGFSLPVSVNVSRTDIYDLGLEEILTGLLKENSLSPSELLLEITESAYTDDSKQIVETVERLRKIGFKVEMDDFGSGYSSLNMLASLPIDALKLDMGFVKGIAKNEKDFRMARFVLEIASYLGAKVVAEGVETKEQYELLKNAGCDIIQGYYFSKPLPASDFEALIQKEISERGEK